MKPTLLMLMVAASCVACTTSSSDPPPPPDTGVQSDVAAESLPGEVSSAVDTAPGVEAPAADVMADVSGRDALPEVPGTDAGAGDGGTGSGLERGRLVGQMTPAEAAKLCDFTNAAQGGYGRKVTCPGGEDAETDESLASCVTDFVDLRPALERCRLTVAHMEDCARAIGPDLCKFETAVECEPLVLCR